MRESPRRRPRGKGEGAMRRKVLLSGLVAVGTGVLLISPAAASANVSAAPTNITFPGNQAIGSTSAPQPVTVNATCSVSIPLFGCLIAGPFQPDPAFTGPAAGDFAQTNNCGSGFDSDGSCTFNVTFTPTGTGVRTATFHVGSDTSAPFGSTQAEVAVGGRGAPAPTPPGTSPTTTGQRGAAIRKCKKLRKGPRRTKCLKKAKKLPV